MFQVPGSRFQVLVLGSGSQFEFWVLGSMFVRVHAHAAALQHAQRSRPERGTSNIEPALEPEPRTRTRNLEPGTWNLMLPER
jgi:hypothetical protein